MPEHEWPSVDLIARLMGEDLGNQRLQQGSNLQLDPIFGIIRCDDIQLVIVEIPPGTEWLNSENGSGVTSADALAPVFQPLFTRQTFCTDENLRSVTLCVFHGCIPPRFHI